MSIISEIRKHLNLKGNSLLNIKGLTSKEYEVADKSTYKKRVPLDDGSWTNVEDLEFKEYVHSDLWYKQVIIDNESHTGDISETVINRIARGISEIFLDGQGSQSVYLDGLNEATDAYLQQSYTYMQTLFERFYTHPVRLVSLRTMDDKTVLGSCSFNFDVSVNNNQSKQLHSAEIVWMGTENGWQLVDYTEKENW